ncbi:MAG: hypothetical protein AAF655_24835 [Bacteroidota bacterium]
MSDQHHIDGHQNIIIQDVTDSHISIEVNGEVQEISKQVEELKKLLREMKEQVFLNAGKLLNIDQITPENFSFFIEQARKDKSLPGTLAGNLLEDNSKWYVSLKNTLVASEIPVGNKPPQIIEHYGWLIEEFLRKMLTPEGKTTSLKALSYMTEAWQSSLRYLCYIQIAQQLKSQGKEASAVEDYIQILKNREADDSLATRELAFDYLGLLISSNHQEEHPFMPEMQGLLDKLIDTQSDVYAAALFMEENRRKLLAHKIGKEELGGLLHEFRTALVFWLRELVFLAKYRLVSIKDIALSYRMGTARNFVHLYGELHGMYNWDPSFGMEDYTTISIENVYTYNQSVLLFKGTSVRDCLQKLGDETNYLSLSPMLIDLSVFEEKETQTPEIYYYQGANPQSRQFEYALYKNELNTEEKVRNLSNKVLKVRNENLSKPRLNDLFEQLENVFDPFNRKSA